MKKIPLTTGEYALIDDEDYPVISRFTWRFDSDSSPRSYIYTRKTQSPVTVMMHQLITGGVSRVSFKDGNNLNLQKYNIRVSGVGEGTHGQEKRGADKESPPSSKYKGVSWVQRRNRWYANIKGQKAIY